MIHILLFMLEFRRDLYKNIRQFMVPFHSGASILVQVLAIGGIASMMIPDSYSLFQQVLLFVLILGTARSNESGPFALLGLVHGFILIHWKTEGCFMKM